MGFKYFETSGEMHEKKAEIQIAAAVFPTENL